jgi:ADP-ribose pyrophosphatase YjhB (NUDIX family)
MITAQVVLINKEGLVLGVSRKDNHNDMGLPGGKMDPEDMGDPMVTAIRECKEETGLDATDLELVFAIHKNGNMGYTYLAKYTGEIEHDEPHVVKWLPFQALINGSFGKYNQMVSESLTSMGIEYRKNIDIEAMSQETNDFVKEYYKGSIQFNKIVLDIHYNIYEVYFKGDFEESFDAPPKFEKGLEAIGLKYCVRLSICSDYWPK